jgi:hypothetical protein
MVFMLSACNPNISATSNYKQKINTHNTIAILPFDMVLNLTKGQQNIINEKDQALLSQTLSLDLQKKLYLMLLKYISKHRLGIQLQDVEETLDKLSGKNIRFNDLHQPDKTFILQALGVDAIFEPHMVITQQGVAFSGISPLPVPAGGFAGIDVRNLHIQFGVSVKDHSTDTAFWNYRNEQWYQAPNKIKKDKKEASNDFLEPLFLNLEDIFKAFIVKQPYNKKQAR